MRKIALIVLATIAVSTSLSAQEEILDAIKEAVKAGSAKETSRFFNQNVDVTIDGDLQTYSKTQAEYVLRDFFKNNPPTSFAFNHQGSSKGGLYFAIGEYVSNQKNYRVWMRIKNINNNYLIHEISFIKE